MSDREDRVGEAVAWYYRAAEAGGPPDPAALLARFPDLRPELESFLADKAAFDRAAGPPAAARPDLAAAPPSAGPGDATVTLPLSLDPASTTTATPTGVLPDGHLGSVRYFGDYELLAEIARGGMGVVFRARQVSLNRPVALKMILTGELASAADVARFRAEAEAAANLDHPNVLPIYEVGEHHGQPYFAMKLVPGGSLAGRVTDLVGDPRAAAAVVATVCRAVDFAHRRGILHRDLKPGNVLLDADGTPYVTDFGLAKKVDVDSNLTQSGAVVGSPSYMAPEQARAEKQLTTAADVYALGAILYQLLAGRPPFRGASVLDTLLQVLEKEPGHPRAVNPTADRDLSVVALKCLAKDPARRYESAAALADDLDRWARGEPIAARPVTRAERAAKWVRRNPVVSALATAAAAALVAGVVVSSHFAVQAGERATEAGASAVRAERNAADATARAEEARREKDRADAKTAEAQANAERAKRLAGELTLVVETEKEAHAEATRREKEARWNAYVARLFPMQAAWGERNLGQLERLLRESVPKAGEPDFRGWEWYYFRDQVRQAGTTLPRSGGVADWCRKTGRIAALADGDRIEVWDRDQEKVERSLPAPQRVSRLLWSPAGDRLACGSGRDKVVVWDVAAGKVLYEHGEKEIEALAWSADGGRLASGHGDGRIRVWEARTGRALKEWTSLVRAPDSPLVPFAVCGLAWHPDGVRLAATGRFGVCRVYDTVAGKTLFSRDTGSGGAWVYGVAWSPDGTKLAAGLRPTVFDEEGRALFTVKTAANAARLAWSPDGEHLLAGGDQELKIWDGAAGDEVQTWRLHDSPVGAVAWSPDGAQVLSAGKEAKVCPAFAKEETRFAARSLSAAGLGRPAWSPDGRWLAAGGSGGILLCDARTGELNAAWKTVRVPNPTVSVAWGPDSAQLAVLDYTGGPVVRDRETAAVVRSLPVAPGAGGNWGVAWSKDGKWLAVANQAGANSVWSTESWRSEGLLGDARTYHLSLAASPDGRHLATGDYGGIGVWDVAKRSRVVWAACGTVRGSTAWSPDGRLLAGATEQGTIPVVRFADGKVVFTARGHTTRVSGAYWSPDGRRLASSSHDGAIKLWDAATGDPLVTLPNDGVKVHGLTWSPDGRRLACTCSDGSLRVWGSPDLEATPKGAAHLETGVLAAAVRPPADIKEAPAGPFFTLARAGRPTRGWATLADAVAKAEAGDTIEIRGDGPFETAPIDTGTKALLIRAGPGCWPVVRPARRHSSAGKRLITSSGPLVLEGVELQRLGSPEDAAASLVWARGSVRVAHARLVMTEPGHALGSGSATEVVNSQLSSPWACVKVWANPTADARLEVRNCVLSGGTAVNLDVPQKPARMSIRLQDSTLVAHQLVSFTFKGSADTTRKESEPLPLLLASTGNVLAGRIVEVMTCGQESGIRTAGEAGTGLKRLAVSMEEGNLLSAQQFLAFSKPPAPGSEVVHGTYEDWGAFWGRTTLPSLLGEPVFDGGDVRTSNPKDTLPAAFRLAAGSPGRGAGPGGKDLGAAVDLIGPGPAYDRWRQTPEYRTWLAETEKFLAGG